MSERNKEVIRRLYGEVMAKGNMHVADEIFAPDYVDHMPITETPDRDGLLKSVDTARLALTERIGNDEENHPCRQHRCAAPRGLRSRRDGEKALILVVDPGRGG